MNPKQRQTIDSRIEQDKEKLLIALRKTPVIQVACERSGISRATFYRWKTDDKDFSEKADRALSEGNALISDMAISQLISSIRDKNLGAIRFWLNHHHPDYKTRVSLEGKVQIEQELTPEQKALVEQALLLAGLSTPYEDGNTE